MKRIRNSGRIRLAGALVLLVSLFGGPAAAFDSTPWSWGSWPLANTWSSAPGYAGMPYNYGFMNPYSAYTRYGGNPAAGFWRASPNSFLYQRPGFAGGPYGYVQGWISPEGDFEGVMVMRGNMRKIMGDYRNRLYNYYYYQ